MSRKWLAPASFTLTILAWAAPAWAATASLVADINATPTGIFPSPSITALQAFGSGVLFLSNQQLWRSDGTVLGTQMVHDFCPDSEVCTALPPQLLGTLGSWALLFVDGQLWTSDGTPPGTRTLGVQMSAPQAPDSPIFGLTQSALYFFSCGSRACGLWKSDGTPAGTAPVVALLTPPETCRCSI